jgi:type VI secretion system protein ImpK
MSPDFAAAVDPLILSVLGLLERIERNEYRSAEEEREQVQNRLREAEDQLGEKSGWELAKYALVAWIDEVLIAAPWEGSHWWENNLLEFAHFKTRVRAAEFYAKAKEARELSRRDALEVFYVCVVLGFRGLYALPEGPILADQLQLPADVDGWAARTARSIKLGQGRVPIPESPRVGGSAFPLEGRYAFLSALLGTALLVILGIIIGFNYFKWRQSEARGADARVAAPASLLARPVTRPGCYLS